MDRALAFATLALLAFEAEARRNRPYSESISTGDPFALLVAVCFGMAYFHVKHAFKLSASKGYQAMAICIGLGIAGVMLPSLWAVFALGGSALLIWKAVHGFRR